MKINFEIIKKYKWILLGILGLIITGALFYFSYHKKQTPLVPVVTTEKPFRVLTIYPPSGVRGTIDGTQPFSIKFTLPVEPSSVIIQVTPQINLKARVYDDKSTLVIYPDINLWQPNVTYQILLSNVTSTTNEKLDSPINYLYINKPPTTVITGEDHVENPLPKKVK